MTGPNTKKRNSIEREIDEAEGKKASTNRKFPITFFPNRDGSGKISQTPHAIYIGNAA